MEIAGAQGSSIAEVERDTGIGRDALRVWERRYGFPQPGRDHRGQRIYPEWQVRKLQLIKRLMDRGYRPGGIVGLSDAELRILCDQRNPAIPRLPSMAEGLVSAVIRHDPKAVGAALSRALERQGLRRLVLETLVPAVQTVGDLWAAGELEVFEEHLFTRTVTKFLDAILLRTTGGEGNLVLLATLPGEPHGLGLLMAETLLAAGGRDTLNLGTEVPLQQLARAVVATGAGTIALSFSSAFPYGRLRPDLLELVSRVPAKTQVWIGGAGVQRLRRLPPEITRMRLEDL